MRTIATLIAMLHCPDYGQAMAGEFYMAAPNCSFIECTDETLAKLHTFTKSMRERANRQTDVCLKDAILDYADYLDSVAAQQRSEWEDMQRADQQRKLIKK